MVKFAGVARLSTTTGLGLPAPNAANGLYTYAPSLKYDQKQFLARFDSEITSRDRIMGRFGGRSNSRDS